MLHRMSSYILISVAVDVKSSQDPRMRSSGEQARIDRHYLVVQRSYIDHFRLSHVQPSGGRVCKKNKESTYTVIHHASQRLDILLRYLAFRILEVEELSSSRIFKILARYHGLARFCKREGK